jgi:chromate transport protein ChrA
MTGIDSALLNFTERVCRRLQILTGRTNVWLAFQLTNLSIIVYFVWAVAYFQRLTTSARVVVAVSCGVIVYMLSQTVFKESIDAAEQYAYRRVAKGLRNPRRLRDAPLRISFLSLSVILLYPIALVPLLRVPFAILTYSLVLLTTVLLYVLSCDPLPPCAAKLKEWFRRLVPSRLVTESTRASRTHFT